MMKLAGHTMGAPEYTLKEAIDLFAAMKLDGIELIVQTDGYPCAIPLDATEAELAQVKAWIEEAGIAVAGLTPYLNLFNSTDEAIRQKECDDLKRVIDMAEYLGAGFIRIYGGKFVDGESDPGGEKAAQLAKSMRACGDYCAPKGIKLCLENHFGTMTTSAARTMELMAQIDHPNVGVLYDQANLAFFPAEEYEEAVALQKDKIFFVHCKDLVYRGGKPQPPKFKDVAMVREEDRTVSSRIPGQGVLNWPATLKLLKEIGYDGWISMEYERRWQRIDLPDCQVGMPLGAAYIKGILQTLEL